jgi:uncharacterized membrane protein YgcG
MKQFLKNIGMPVLALMAILVCISPRPADAAVRFGVYLGGPVYPTYPYAYPYSYYDPYYQPYAYPYSYGYAYPYGYASPYYGGLYWGGGHGGHFEHGFRGSERGFRGGERGSRGGGAHGGHRR